MSDANEGPGPLRILRGAVAVLACAGVLAGCGGGDDDGKNDDRFEGEAADIARVVDELGQAARDKDAKKICEDLMTINLQVSIRRAAGTSCGAEVTENLFVEDASFRAEKIDVDGDNATAEVVDQDDRRSSLLFQKGDDGWRIARIGG